MGGTRVQFEAGRRPKLRRLKGVHNMAAHEDFRRRAEFRSSSDRSFGLLFALVLAILALYPLRHGTPVRWWSFGLSLLMLVTAVSKPSLLHPLNHWWARFALILRRVGNLLITGILFYLVITPTGLLFRLLRKDLLLLGFDPGAESYWIPRDPSGPDPKSMSRQF